MWMEFVHQAKMSIFTENASRAPSRQLLEETFNVLMLHRAHI